MTIRYMQGFDFVPEHKTREDILDDIRSVVHEYHEASKLPPEPLPEIPDPLPMLVVPDVKDEISFLPGANSGNRRTSLEYLKLVAAVHHLTFSHHDCTLYDDLVQPEIEQPEFSEVFSPTVHLTPWAVNGYIGEANPREFEWIPELTVVGRARWQLYKSYNYYGEGRNRRYFVAPAHRQAGLNAYKLKSIEILKQKKPSDRYSHWVLALALHPREQLEWLHVWLHEWLHSLIQSGLDEAFMVVKKPHVPLWGTVRPR